MRIGKNHPVLELLKQIHKTNHYPNLIYSDDLEVLKIASGDRFQIPYLLYSFEEKFQAETEKLLETLKTKLKKLSKFQQQLIKNSHPKRTMRRSWPL